MRGGNFLRKAKGISIIAITLLILQILTVNIGVGAVFGAVDVSTNSTIHVKHLRTEGKALTWQIDVDVNSEQKTDAKVLIAFDKGQSHGTINHDKSLDGKNTDVGYELDISNGSGLYQIELQTEITDTSKVQFELKAALKVDGKEVVDSAKAEVKVKEENNASERDDGEKVVSEVSENKAKENRKSLDDIIAELESKPIEQFTEAEIKKLVEGLSEDELEKISEALGQDAEIGVIDPNFKPFAKNKSMRSFNVMSTPGWPNPGSVKLNGKTATRTGNYGEWEIELSVESMDIDTTKTTDIVLVFDKSGSMNERQRLTKAKAAARQFVNELLTDDSQTRIAIVTFSSDYQTLAGGFQGVSGKQNLINAINGISASGGTNIQGGLRTANNLLADESSAQNKVIVLLSDGAPTYSYKANNATSHTWPFGSYNYRLTNFTSTQLGSGSSYNLSAPTCFLGICWGGQQYSVNGYDVKTNGIGTISEAWQIMNNGINMYSIGLDVGSDNNAMNVLRNSQNKGVYFGTGDDLNPIFEEIAGSLKYAATDAKVTDPLGDMFNLVKGKYSGAHFTVSQGTVTWDDATETFTWNIGTIKEGEKPTLKYTVTIDWEHPDLKGHVDYPMNKETPLNYKDVDGNNATKYFDIPKGQIDKGKIKRIGYRVNPAGEPIDASGNVVSSPDLAEQFYDEYYGDFHDFGSHDVPAKDVADYTVIVGANPTTITLGPDNPVGTVLFGYVKTSDMIAGDVTAEYKDENGDTIASSETYSGTIGAHYTTEKKDIDGYEFVRTEGANPSGTFTAEPQTVTYIYKKLLGSITINKVDENGEPLAGAEFTLTGPNGYAETKSSLSDGEIVFDELEWGTYTLKETKAPYEYRLLNKSFDIEINAENLTEEITIENTRQGWEIPKTGGIGTLGFFGVGFMLMAGAGWFVFRRRHV